MFQTILRLNSDFAYIPGRRRRVLHRRELARAHLLPGETVLLVKAMGYCNTAGRTGACTGASFSYRKHVETIVVSEPLRGPAPVGRLLQRAMFFVLIADPVPGVILRSSDPALRIVFQADRVAMRRSDSQDISVAVACNRELVPFGVPDLRD